MSPSAGLSVVSVKALIRYVVKARGINAKLPAKIVMIPIRVKGCVLVPVISLIEPPFSRLSRYTICSNIFEEGLYASGKGVPGSN